MKIPGGPIRTAEVNLRPVAPDDLELLAFGNYGHYTSMQVRDHRVRGLQPHLTRLEANSREMFAEPVERSRVIEALMHAVPATGAFSVRVTVFSRDLAQVLRGSPVQPDVMVSVSPPAASAVTSIRVLPVQYQRETPDVKHLATYGLLRASRTARLAGFDDALFFDAAGRILEGTTWNIVFMKGDEWLWPEGPALEGITKQLLQGAMSDASWTTSSTPVHADSIGQFTAAFATNSVTAARPISAIGDHVLESGAAAASIQGLADSVAWDAFADAT